MKKIIPALVLSLASTGVWAVDGTIKFTGEIKANSCQLDASAPGTSFIKSVILPAVSNSNFTAIDDTAGTTKFEISLTTCDAKTVKAHFDPGPTLDQTTGNVKIAERTDLQVQLLNAAGLPIQLATGTNNEATTLTGAGALGAGTMVFYARYIAKEAVVAAGKVQTEIPFTLVYN